MVERHSYKVDVDGSIPSGRTIWEIAKSLGAALATPPPDANAAKGKFKSAESRRKKRMKKNAKISLSWKKDTS